MKKIQVNCNNKIKAMKQLKQKRNLFYKKWHTPYKNQPGNSAVKSKYNYNPNHNNKNKIKA